jgi:hypothetical protein
MKPQIIQDSSGHETGVFIPIDKWNLIKDSYPDIENVDIEIPQWQKDLLDERLAAIQSSPSKVKPIDSLITILDN